MKAITFPVNSQINYVCQDIEYILDCITKLITLSDECIFDIRVILNELIANAITHGCCSHRKSILVSFKRINNKYIYLSVFDNGPGFKASSGNYKKIEQIDYLNQTFCEHGRGLFIVEHLCKYIKFNSMGNKISVLKSIK